MRSLLALVLLCAACHGGGLDPAHDASGGEADASSACPVSMPASQSSTCSTEGLSCTYGDTVCDCRSGDGDVWYCRSTNCPASASAATGSCSQEGLLCVYGFEDGCSCNDGSWLCCGGVVQCPDAPVHDGDPCCGADGVGDCDGVVDGGAARCTCENNRYVCVAAPGDGGT